MTDDGVIFPGCVCVCGGGGGIGPTVTPLDPRMHLHYRNNPVYIGYINNFEFVSAHLINSDEFGNYSPLTKNIAKSTKNAT